MTDTLLLIGTGLCVLSVIAAVIALLQTRAPRGAAILLVGGILVLAVTAWLYPGSVGLPQLQAAWSGLFG